MNRPEVLALIPARGGSKSIPRKNVIPVAGKPLIAWTIEQALACPSISRTLVSTDDAEIAEVARQAGAEVPFIRPKAFAQDLSPDVDAFRHALEWLAREQGYTCDLVVHLRPTGPIRRPELIEQAIALMLDNQEADSLRSVSSPSQTPYKMWRIDGGWLKPLLAVPGVAEPYSMPRQMLPQTYWQNGYVDVVRPHTILSGRMAGESIIPFVIDEPIYELDYPEDVLHLEAALEGQKPGRQAMPGPTAKRHPV